MAKILAFDGNFSHPTARRDETSILGLAFSSEDIRTLALPFPKFLVVPFSLIDVFISVFFLVYMQNSLH